MLVARTKGENVDASVSRRDLATTRQETQTTAQIVPPAVTIPHPITNALDTATGLIQAANATGDIALRRALISQALAIGNSLSSQIVNPLSLIHPRTQDFQYTKQLLLLCHSSMIQVLCQDNFEANLPSVREHLKQIVVMLGHAVLCMHKTKMSAIWYNIHTAVYRMNWTFARRVHEWKLIAQVAPNDPYFTATRFWSHYHVMLMEMTNLENFLAEGNIDETRDGVAIMQEVADEMTRYIDILASPAGEKYLPCFDPWTDPQYSRKVSWDTFQRFNRVKMELHVWNLLRKGNSLLDLATDRMREVNRDYFTFQALLAMDSYRTAYQLCARFEEINVELEARCIWSMGRVAGKYLGLDEHAYYLYFQVVKLVVAFNSLLPRGEWYADSVEQIQLYQKKMEAKELKQQEQERAQMLEILAAELIELQSRAEGVKDEKSLREFFRWLLHTHQPRYPGPTEIACGMLESRELCKVVLNVIAVYDISGHNNCDDPWIVLCEEIVKVHSPSHNGTKINIRL